jgi:hypothetical protein
MLGAASNDELIRSGRSSRGRIVVLGIGYLLVTVAASVVVFVHLRYGHCGELSSPRSCDFVRGAGTPLVLIAPAFAVVISLLLAVQRNRALFLHVCAGAAVVTLIVLDVSTVA